MNARVLKDDAFIADDWQTLGDEDVLPTQGSIIVTLRRWRADANALRSSGCNVGVLIPNTEDMDVIFSEISDRKLLVLQIPTMADGRALTQARLLRGRLGYRGELRGVGDILSDLILFMRRCGFDSIVPRADQDPETCLRALREFSVFYQPAADGQKLIFTRRRGQTT